MKTTIAKSDLLETLTFICAKGARPLTITMATVQKCLKKDRNTQEAFSGEIIKVSRVNGMLNFDYEKAVNRQLGREGQEGTFTAQPNWFEHALEFPRPIVRKKSDHSQLYVQVKSERVIESEYILNGAPVDKFFLPDVLPLPSVPKNQGTDKPILTFTVSFDSILSFVCDGVEYLVGDTVGVQRVASVQGAQVAKE